MKIVTSPGLDMKSRICIDQCVTQERDSSYWQACQLHGNVGSLHSREFKMLLLDARSHDNLFTIMWLATCWPTGVRVLSRVEILSVTESRPALKSSKPSVRLSLELPSRARTAAVDIWPLISASSQSYECVDSPHSFPPYISLWCSVQHEIAVFLLTSCHIQLSSVVIIESCTRRSTLFRRLV